jgi:hypothetical protein
MSVAFLPPLYFVLVPLLNHKSVGYPLTSYLLARDLAKVASTLAIVCPVALRVLAALAYSGASDLQCPLEN